MTSLEIARVRFFAPTDIGHAMLVDLPFGSQVTTDQGAPVQLTPVTDRVTRATFLKPRDQHEVVLVEGEPTRRATMATLRWPRLFLSIDWERRPLRIASNVRLAEGPLRRRERMAGQFATPGRAVASCRCVHEVLYPGIQILQVSFGNNVRSPEDVTGNDVDGELNFSDLLLELPSRSHIAVFQDDTPKQYRSGGDIVLARGGVLTRRRRFQIRLALCDEAHEHLAREELRFETWGVVVEGLGYIQRGGFGPLEDHLLDLDDARFHYRGNHGMEAVVHMARDERARLQNLKATSPYLLPARGSTEGNDPGGLDIQPHLGHLQCPDWHHATALTAELYGNRMSSMLKPDCDPLTIWDVAGANGGSQPWLVKRTNRAEQNPAISIPWPSQTGHPWNEGSSEEESYQRSYADIDHAHSIRLIGPLIGQIWGTDDQLAKEDLRALVAHYQYDPTLFRHDGNSIPRLQATGKANPEWGDGALGRQIAWPAYAFAAAWQVSDRDWRRVNKHWRQELYLALHRLTSPAGGNRARRAPNWSWASPKPNLPADSPLVVDQVFEMTYYGLAALAMAKTYGNSREESDARSTFETVAEGLNGLLEHPMWGKFVAFATDEDGGTLFDVLQNITGSSGSNHQGNLCGAAWQHFRDEKYFDRAKQWLGLNPMDGDEEYLAAFFAPTSNNWEGPQSHHMLDFWWHANVAAFVQQTPKVTA